MKEIYVLNGVDAFKQNDIIEIHSKGNFYYSIQLGSNLKAIQDNININFLSKIPLNNSCTAFRSGLSYYNFLEPHIGSYNYIRLDIKSFFHSIPLEMLRVLFLKYFEDEYLDVNNKQKLVDGFIKLVTFEVSNDSLNKNFKNKTIVPIGFKTSPTISNIFFRELDILIQRSCISKGIIYTRYADDMLFSSKKENKFITSESFSKDISILISRFGFKLNHQKTIQAKHTISLNGYTISYNTNNSESPSMRVSNKKIRIIEKIIHKIKKNEPPETILYKLFGFRINSRNFKYLPPKNDFTKKYCKDQLFNKIIGYRSFLLSAIKFNYSFECITETSVNKYLTLVIELEEIVKKLNNEKLS